MLSIETRAARGFRQRILLIDECLFHEKTAQAAVGRGFRASLSGPIARTIIRGQLELSRRGDA